MDNIEKVVGEALEKSLPEIVDAVTEKKFAQLQEKTVAELEDVKAELKKYALATKTGSESGRKAFKEAFVVGVVKDAIQNNVSTEGQFQKSVERVEKAMNTGTDGEGAEFVFEQFEADVLSVMDSFEIVRDVRTYTINKGDNLTLIKGNNTLQAYFTAEGASRTETEYGTADIKVTVAKITTLTKLTEEFFDDTMSIPDVYNLLVQFIGETQAEFLETQILQGTGNDIKGIFGTAGIKVVEVANSSAINDDDLVSAITQAEKKFSRRNAKWYMSLFTKGQLMKLKTTDGSPLYPELRQENASLLGYPVVLTSVGVAQDTTEGGSASKVQILFGDLANYAMVRRRGLSVERGHTGADFAEDKIAVKSTVRAGGACTFPEAITVIRNAA